MALATRCPNCNALFRVAAEQLRTRGGMVRCGACRQIFNAIAGLDYLDAQRFAMGDPGPSTVPAPPAAPDRTHAPSPASPPLTSANDRAAQPAPGTNLRPEPPEEPAQARQQAPQPVLQQAPQQPPQPASPQTPLAAATPAPTPRGPASRHPSPAVSTASERPADSSAAADRRRNPRFYSGAPESTVTRGATSDTGFRIASAAAPSDPQETGTDPDTLFAVATEDEAASNAAAGGRADDISGHEPAVPHGQDAPSFLLETRPGPLTRGLRIAGCAVLAPLLAAQLGLIFRAPLVVTFPALRPALQTLCMPIKCTASWPMRPDLLAVVSSELQAVPGTSVLELDTVLRNRAAFALALPAIELTISDNNGRAVARKVFLPGEYLDPSTPAGADPAAGNIAAGGDLAVRVYFDLPGISATNFEAYPFYP